MSDVAMIAGLAYAGLSLILGAAAAAFEAGSPPAQLDRAGGRSEFQAPTDNWITKR